MTGIPEFVANGAQMLDRVSPGWYRLINLDTLKLESCEKCVCGQLGQKLGWQLFPCMEEFPAQYGFDMPHAVWMDIEEEDLAWKELDEEWHDAITSRLAFDKLPAVEREAVTV